MANRWKALGLWMGLVGLGACTPEVQFSDDMDFRIDLRRVGGSDRLSMPYVQGADVKLLLTGHRDFSSLEVVSSDPDVFQILSKRGDSDEINLDCVALSAGTSELVVTKPNGKVVGTTVVEVGEPNRAELHGAGAVFARLGEATSEVFDPLVLEGGRATFEVRWFDGNERLFGNGVLVPEVEGAISARDERTFLGENREWIRVDGDALGSAQVHLDTLDGTRIETHAVEVVGPESIEAIMLLGDHEADAEAGDRLTVLGEARDGAERVVYGVEFEWMQGQVQQLGSGDLFRYLFDPTLPASDLSARFDGLTSKQSIQGQGEVGSSNAQTCSTGGDASIGIASFLALFGMRRRG